MDGKRWYDRSPTMSKMVEIMRCFPLVLQGVIADTVEARFKERGETLQVKTVGRDKIVGLNKSIQKRRFYDKNPSFRRLMNYIYLMPESSRELVAEQIIEVVYHTLSYMQIQDDLDIQHLDTDVLTVIFSRYNEDMLAMMLDELKVYLADKVLTMQKCETTRDYLARKKLEASQLKDPC